MTNLKQLKERKEKLEDLLAEGTLRIKNGEEVIEYRSVKELILVIGRLNSEISEQTVGRTGYNKPFTPKQGKGL